MGEILQMTQPGEYAAAAQLTKSAGGSRSAALRPFDEATASVPLRSSNGLSFHTPGFIAIEVLPLDRAPAEAAAVIWASRLNQNEKRDVADGLIAGTAVAAECDAIIDDEGFEWGIEFALRCTAAGNDARLCTCVADEIKKRWTPDEFKSVRPEALQDETRRCRERLRLDDGS